MQQRLPLLDMGGTHMDANQKSIRNFALSPESWVLLFICLADLASTIFLVNSRDAVEANPLMAFYLEHGGTFGFALAKITMLAMPLAVAEWARRKRPRFVQQALRFTIMAYVVSYSLGVFQMNREAITAQAMGQSSPDMEITAR